MVIRLRPCMIMSTRRPPHIGARSPSALITSAPTAASTTPLCQDGNRRIAASVRQYFAEWQPRIPVRGRLCHASRSQQISQPSCHRQETCTVNGGHHFSTTLAHTSSSRKSSLEREPNAGPYVCGITLPINTTKAPITRNDRFVLTDTPTLLHTLPKEKLRHQVLGSGGVFANNKQFGRRLRLFLGFRMRSSQTLPGATLNSTL